MASSYIDESNNKIGDAWKQLKNYDIPNDLGYEKFKSLENYYNHIFDVGKYTSMLNELRGLKSELENIKTKAYNCKNDVEKIDFNKVQSLYSSMGMLNGIETYNKKLNIIINDCKMLRKSINSLFSMCVGRLGKCNLCIDSVNNLLKYVDLKKRYLNQAKTSQSSYYNKVEKYTDNQGYEWYKYSGNHKFHYSTLSKNKLEFSEWWNKYNY